MKPWQRELLDSIAAQGASPAGFADIDGLAPPKLAEYNHALAFAIPMDPRVMAGIANGPTPEYSALYQAVNIRIDETSRLAAGALERAGYKAWPVSSSIRSDPVNIRGDFPHKTAATRAGLGWIGRHAQLVNFKLGPWLRLGTVLFRADPGEVDVGRPVERSYCGDCRACVDACPAQAIRGETWTPGLDREALFSPRACDQWKKEHYFEFLKGHNCGICTAACIYGQKRLKRETA